MPKDLRSRLAELNSTLPWALPLLGLIAISVSFAAVLSRMTDGREVTDDGFLLLYLVRHPLFIWDSYETNYLGRQWGSFPPLFPLFFGALVKPWTQVASNFWALRLGVLTWACVVLVSLSYLLTHVERVPTSRVRSALWLLVLVPSA